MGREGHITGSDNMIRQFFKDILPTRVSDVLRRGDLAVYRMGQSLRRRYHRERNRARSAEDVFTEVYKKNFWGGTNGESCIQVLGHVTSRPTYMSTP